MGLCPCSACHQLRLDLVLLYDRLFDPFDHRSRLNTVTDVVSATVNTVTVDSPLLCSSDSSIAFNVIASPGSSRVVCFTVIGLLSSA